MPEIDEIASVLECMIPALDMDGVGPVWAVNDANHELEAAGYHHRFVILYDEWNTVEGITIGVVADAIEEG